MTEAGSGWRNTQSAYGRHRHVHVQTGTMELIEVRKKATIYIKHKTTGGRLMIQRWRAPANKALTLATGTAVRAYLAQIPIGATPGQSRSHSDVCQTRSRSG